MTPRERVLSALSHKEPDLIPLDLGGTESSGITGVAYNRLRKYLGLCQGKTCGQLVMGILARETNRSLHEVMPDTDRPPVRAVPINVLANRSTDDGHS